MNAVTFQSKEGDFVRAARVHARLMLRQPARVAINLVAIVVIPTSALLTGQSLEVAVAWGLILLTALISLQVFVVMIAAPNAVKRQYREQPSLGRQTHFEWDEQGFRAQSQSGNSIIPWSDVFAFREADDLLLLYMSGQSYMVFPLKELSEAQRSDLRRSLKQSGVPDRRKPKRR